MAEASGVRIIGEQPKPRVLLGWWDEGEDELRAAIEPHAPTIRGISGLHEVRQADYDVLVTDRFPDVASHAMASAHLFVVSFSNADAYGALADEWTYAGWRAQIGTRVGLLSQTVAIADQPDDLSHLINDRLAPVLQARSTHLAFSRSVRQDSDSASPIETLANLRPFASLPTGEVLAGAYDRSHLSEGWVLPADVLEPAAWIIAALRLWAVKHRQFPVVGGWWDDERWQTRGEIEAAAKVHVAKVKRAAAIAEAESAIADGTAEMEEAQRQAVAGLRCLLEGKGDSLAAAVADALRLLGYEAVDLDAEGPLDEGGRSEDLRLRDPDESGFDPLVEVKGYDQGAKAGDLVKLTRHLTRAFGQGRSVSALWWVVNHWRKRTPDDREAVLAAERATIDEQARDDPPLVVIDTRDLFRAVRDVEDGKRTAAEVRASLRAARGRWTLS